MEESLTWEQKLRNFIKNLLQNIISKQDVLLKLVDEKSMEVWKKAFTHETFSRSDNYEDLEFLGDAILKSVFTKYLMESFPTFHKNQYTELFSSYMSKMIQGEIARSMNFKEYIRVNSIEKASFNLEADVFESFFGALFTVSEIIINGLGFINCYNMIVYLYKNIKIDISKARGSPKTQVLQIFSRFDLSSVEEEVIGGPTYQVTIHAKDKIISDLKSIGIYTNLLAQTTSSKEKDAKFNAYDNAIKILDKAGVIKITESQRKSQDNLITFKVKLSQSHIDFLRRYNINIKDPVIGEASADTKNQAEHRAYENALNFLNRIGITTEWAEKNKRLKEFQELGDLGTRALEKAKQLGYKEIYFNIPKKTVTTKTSIIQLIGEKDNEVKVLGSININLNNKDNNFFIARSYLIKEFLDKVKG